MDTIYPPTTKEQGYTEHKCKICSYTYNDNYVEPTRSEIEEAAESVRLLFASTITSESYHLDSSIKVNGIIYTIAWEIHGEGVTLDDNNVIIPTNLAFEIYYSLNATISDSDGNTETFTINFIVPAPNKGRNGISKYAENSISFTNFDNATILTAPITSANGTHGGSLVNKIEPATWNTIIGTVGENKYIQLGHSGGSSTTIVFGTKGAVVEKDKDFKVDTYVYELDFMYIDAYDPDNWQMKFQFAAADINVTVNYKPAVEAVEGKDAVYDKTGIYIIEPAVEAVEAQPAKFLLGGKEYDLNTWYTIRFELTMGEEKTGKDGVTKCHVINVDIYVNNEFVKTETKGGTFTETAATDTTPAKSTPKMAWEVLDNTFRINTRARAQYVEIAVDNVYYGYHTAGYVPPEVDTVDTETEYLIASTMGLGELYFAGTCTNGRLDGTNDWKAAKVVKLEKAGETDGEYYLYFMDGDTKKYIGMDSSNADTSCFVISTTADTNDYVWVIDTTSKTIVNKAVSSRGIATQNTSTYTNFSSYATSNFSESNYNPAWFVK